MLRQIVYFQIPSFRIALSRLKEPALRGRPVVVAPRSQRAPLFEVSREAAGYGVYPGMPAAHARFLCPALKIVSPAADSVHGAQRAIEESVRRLTPIWEEAGDGSFYLDLTGTGRIFGRAIDTAARLEGEIRQRAGLSGVAGIAANKLVSHIAATMIAETSDLHGVAPGKEEEFLAPLPVAMLPSLPRLYGTMAADVLETLDELDLTTLGKVGDTPVGHLELVLGRHAALIRHWAGGSDPTPVWPRALRPSLEISQTLDTDEIDDAPLLAALYGLAEKICRELRRAGRMCGGIRLDLVQSDGFRISTRGLFPRATHFEHEFYPRLEELFFRSFQRRVRIRKIDIAAESLQDAKRQLSLFDDAAARGGKAERLSAALDRLRGRYGERAVGWGGR